MVFTTYLWNMDINTTKKILLQAISELQSKRKGQYLGKAFLWENYQWDNFNIDELLTCCINESILRKVVSNEKDFYSLVTYSIKNTQLDDIEVLPGDEHIIPAGESSSYCLKKIASFLLQELHNKQLLKNIWTISLLIATK